MSDPWRLVVLIGVGTIVLRGAAPAVLAGRRLGPRTMATIELLPPALLAALVATQAFATKSTLVRRRARARARGGDDRAAPARAAAGRDRRRGGHHGRRPGRVAGTAQRATGWQCDTAPMLGRRTKIVATLGPATDPPGVLDRLVAAGMDCARLNCSHGTHEDLRRRAAAVRAAASAPGGRSGCCSTCRGRSCGSRPTTETRVLRAGETVVVLRQRAAEQPDRVLVDFAYFAALRHRALADRDRRRRAAARVERVAAATSSRASCRPGRSRRARASTSPTPARSCPRSPRRTSPTWARGRAGRRLRGAVVRALGRRHRAAARRTWASSAAAARVIAKIEKVEAYEQLDEIIAVADGMMVARGDYGVEAGVAHVPLMQKDTIARATQAGQARDHRDADARVDDPRARADARRGHRRRQRRDRRHARP